MRVAAGETLDEVAKTYDISMQRVHQIVFGRRAVSVSSRSSERLRYQPLGRYSIATNITDVQRLPPEALLSLYGAADGHWA